MTYLMWIPALGGIALIAGTLFYIFRTNAFPGTMLGLAFMGAFLVALPYSPHFGYKNGEFTMELAQQTSLFQGDIAHINQKLDVLLQRGGPLPPNAVPARKNYSVLIFYGEGRSKLANDVKTWLLSDGYSASATPTDFSELGESAGKPGTAAFRYAQDTASNAPNLAQELSTKFPSIGSMQTISVAKLAHGDAQLLLF